MMEGEMKVRVYRCHKYDYRHEKNGMVECGSENLIDDGWYVSKVYKIDEDGDFLVYDDGSGSSLGIMPHFCWVGIYRTAKNMETGEEMPIICLEEE